ncbi:MAG: hypothetical protein E7014_05715 [Alphaproteobacteria bacterium]|nr:hypothetical protein [Alphaproteobacteria bacterium]
MKKLFIKILPYVVAFFTGILMYILTEKLITDSGLNNLMINIASGLVSIPTVFIFYDIINKLTSRNLHNSLFESVTFEINHQLTELINFICTLINTAPPTTPTQLDDFLELDNEEIYHNLIFDKINTQQLTEIKTNLITIIHKQTSFEILTEKQISAILNIIKEITFLNKNLNFLKTNNKQIKHKKIISLNIEYLIDNLTTWIESGKKDAFNNHARFSLTTINSESKQ